MARVCVGLDIGTSAIKVAQLSKVGASYKLDRVGVAPLPMGAIEGGTVHDVQTVAQTIVRLLRESKIGCRQVMAAVAGEAVIHRLIRVPLVPRRELDGIVHWESEKHIPFPIDEAIYDYDIIQEFPEENEQEIILVAAQRSLIESHVAVLRAARLQALAIDVQPLALSRALEPLLSPPGMEGTANVAIMDVGAGSTDLAIFRQGVQRFIRILPIAGNYFTRAIATRLGISSEEAENLKRTHGQVPLPDQPIEGEEDRELARAIEGVMAELTAEIRRSLDYFRLQFREDVVRLIAAGGGIGLRNMAPYLARELGINVEIANPLLQLHPASANCAPKILETMGPIFSVAIGLGLRGVQEW
ncbi:MAG: type IV pilus assembly protein PilM [Firmicutes bacterium]|nr:type IV pilus assembly protein PilM [Bacillota bacterium]